MSNSLQDWLTNDPEPNKTLDLLKKKLDWRKKMSKEDPVGLMRSLLTKEEFNDFWDNKRALEYDFTINSGYSADKTLKASWYVPEIVVSNNSEWWDEVFRLKKYTLYPYFLLGNPLAKMSLNTHANFKA